MIACVKLPLAAAWSGAVFWDVLLPQPPLDPGEQKLRLDRTNDQRIVRVFKIRGRAVNKHSIATHQSAGYGLRFFVSARRGADNLFVV